MTTKTDSTLEPITVSVATAMKISGIKKTRMYELMASGDLSSVKVGKTRLVHVKSLNHLLEHGVALENQAA